MTKQCTLKESFIESQLDKFQPKWREGEDIEQATKDKIRAYILSKLPEELKDDVSCITDYSIWHMAKKIRERENLPEPKKSNKGKKVSEHKPDSKVSVSKPSDKEEMSFADVTKKLKELINLSSLNTVKSAIEAIEHCGQ